MDEFSRCFHELASDSRVWGILVTGAGKFFSFGFDIPEFMGAPKEVFAQYLEKFTALYCDLFAYPKPVVAAINGHAVAGGCMLATACDARVMVKENAKIGLNEIGFGSSLFAGSLALLRFWVGDRRAQEVVYSGALYTAEQALALGLGGCDRRGCCDPRGGPETAQGIHRQVAGGVPQHQASPSPADSGGDSSEFVDIWYSAQTRQELEKIKIRA